MESGQETKTENPLSSRPPRRQLARCRLGLEGHWARRPGAGIYVGPPASLGKPHAFEGARSPCTFESAFLHGPQGFPEGLSYPLS